MTVVESTLKSVSLAWYERILDSVEQSKFKGEPNPGGTLMASEFRKCGNICICTHHFVVLSIFVYKKKLNIFVCFGFEFELFINEDQKGWL